MKKKVAKKTAKAAAVKPSKEVLRAQVLKGMLKPAKISAFVKSYAARHGLSVHEATQKLMSVSVGRLTALKKYNAKPPARSSKRKTAKAAAGRVAKRGKRPAARKPRAAKKQAAKAAE